MRYNWWLFVALWGSVFLALCLLPNLVPVRFLVSLACLLLAGLIADLMVKLAVNLLPRKLLPHLHNKAVLITGCSSGFGLALAKRLDSLGVTVYAGLRNPQCAGAVELKETCTHNMHVLVLDVTNDQHVRDAVAYVHNTIGDKEFCAVVNNAGIASGCLLELTPVEEFHKVWETNVLGSVRVTKAFMPLLRKFMGRVVFVNSLFGIVAQPGVLPYTMSKFALHCFGEALRREMKRWRVSVHSVYPYFYKTSITDVDRNMDNLDSMWKHCPQEVRDAYGEKFLALCRKSSKEVLVDLPTSNLNEPIGHIIDAAVGATPKMVYLSGWGAKWYYFLEHYLPRSVVDYVASVASGVF